MSSRTVQDVMTDAVVVAEPGSSYRELVQTMTRHRLTALPVIDATGGLVGVVSETDLLYRLECTGTRGRLLDRRRRAKAEADTAARLMSDEPAIVRPGTPVAEAARIMERGGVERLPVVDDDRRLVGTVSRHDLLRGYLRADCDIHREIVVEVLHRVLLTDPAQIRVVVEEGVVTLTGAVDRRSTAEITVNLVRAVDGVSDVVQRLEWGYDDSAEVNRRYVFDAQIPPTVRWP